MNSRNQDATQVGDARTVFHTTRWDLVLSASEGAVAAAHATDVARAALEDLCQLYRPPMRGYIRSLGYSAHDADDLTQLFLLRLATGKLLHHVDPAKGRFRHFVRVCLKHFLRDEHDRKTARKRGGDVELVLLSEQSASDSGAGASTIEAADLAFDLGWANTVVESALCRVQREYERRGEGETFSLFSRWLKEDPAPEELTRAADQSGVSREAARLRVYRLRREYGAVLREELARTVNAPDEIEAELRYLLRVLTAGS